MRTMICIATFVLIASQADAARRPRQRVEPTPATTPAVTQPSTTDDLIAKVLDEAKSEREQTVAAAMRRCLETIDARIKAAGDRGDLKIAEASHQAREAMQNGEKLSEEA